MNRKIIIIGGVVMIVVMLAVVGLLLTRRVDNPQSDFGSVVVPYSSPSFSLSYPKAWVTDKREIAGGGTSFTARVDSTTEFFPRFTVQSTSLSGQDMEDKIKVLSFYNLQRSETTFKGYSATELAGKLNLEFKTGNPEQKPVYKVFLFVRGPTNLYTISYAYFDDDTREEAKKEMQRMLDSVEIN